jgi:ATP-dependent helicase YprA (DUF1998 family)
MENGHFHIFPRHHGALKTYTQVQTHKAGRSTYQRQSIEYKVRDGRVQVLVST